MDDLELRELTLRLKQASDIKKHLQRNPQSILVIRLSHGLSQTDFIQKMEKKISQVSLIKHEKGRSKRMNSRIIKELMKHLPKTLDENSIVANFRKFESMKKGAHMTSQRARELHRIWKKKTRREQWQEWGRKGAFKSNSQGRLTEQEKKIQKVLDSLAMKYSIHKQVRTKILNMNVDFVITDKKGNPKLFIEATERKHDLPILCQAYAYRCRLIKEAYPKAKVGIVLNELPYSSAQIVKNEFDFILNSDSINNLSKFLQF